MTKTHIRYEIDGDVATILLAPPEGKPPTLDNDVLEELERCIAKALEEMPRMVLVRSASERFFCVGANINMLQHTNEQTIVPWVMQGHRVLNMLEDLPMPVVSVVEGFAMGGGLELAVACDLIFASDTAQLAQSEAGLGFIPGWGGTRRLAGRIGSVKAKYYYYSGKMMDAAKAAEIGLVDFVGNKVALEQELDEFTALVISNNRNALQQFKTILNDQERAARDENAAVEAFRSVSCLQDPDTKQRLHDFLSKKGKK
ncbi:enoyl-CoA hydratase/isomerase family protein [Pontiella sulfatireligans]|uniref:Short-chain-enoyl-CoA hydratase n=1 Tax=Pontiella sulfatireligans TaxID=2750658 RepID=A0A6C2UFR6_9BACT|nr:enoyl-CoA hydratase/isomerase family protein [Pontiella sulfatireligans]VGO18948.1 Short-chain-enoyl-CoA hydratase [Pontiella sulfatireligans]